MDDGCQSIPRPWLNAYSHTHIRSGVKVKERGTCEKVPVTFTLVFFPSFLGISFAVRASRKKFIVCATNYCCRPGIGLGWAAGQIDRWLFFWFFLFFIQAIGERGRCVNNDNNNNIVTRLDPSRSLSLVMMVIIITITILVNYYYYVLSSIQKKKKSRPLRVH